MKTTDKPEDKGGRNKNGSFRKPPPSVMIGLGLVAAGASGSVLAQAQDDTYSTPVNTVLSANNVTDNDLYANTFSTVLASSPSHGSVSLAPDGTFSYTPSPGYAGPDQFSYVLMDSGVGNTIANVNITVGTADAVSPVPLFGPAATGALSASLALLATRLRRRRKDE